MDPLRPGAAPLGLTLLGSGSAAAGEAEDPFALLIACHARIRGFLELASVLAERPQTPAAQRRDAASRVARYFRQAYPLHVRDEEDTLEPLLRLRAEPPLLEALGLLSEQHAGMHASVERLVAVCDEIATAPGEDGGSTTRLQECLRTLTPLMAHHLMVEETRVLPVARQQLSAGERDGLLRAIRERRGTPAR